MELSKQELSKITGGAVIKSKIIIIGGLVSFLIGILDGQIKLKWQNLKNIEFIGNLREKHLIQIRRKGLIMFIKLLDLMLT